MTAFAVLLAAALTAHPAQPLVSTFSIVARTCCIAFELPSNAPR